MAPRLRCVLTLALLVAVLLPLLPAQPLRAQDGITIPDVPAAGETPLPPAPEAITVPPVEDPHLPSLVLRLQTEPHWAAVGDVVTATITILNQAPDPADELTLSLPLPSDATALDDGDPARTTDGWRWQLGTLGPETQTVVTATMRLAQVPAGEALLLEPETIARGLTLPITTVRGVLVTTTPASRPGPAPDTQGQPDASSSASTLEQPATATTPASDATATPDNQASDLTAVGVQPVSPGPPAHSGRALFTPGQPAELRSADGRISVSVPGNAFDRPLELVHRTPTEQRPVLRGRGQAEPPAIAGFYRGFGAFHLEATDDNGRQVKQFKAPLTLTLRFTPQQLQALGLSAETLRIFWFDEEQVVERGRGGVVKGAWTPQLTTIDAEAGTATLQMEHFSAFQLSDGSSPSAAYLPSLQGWQTSGFTGAAGFSYPIEVPAGPAGLKPALTLSYSSAATDGDNGMRPNAQAGWVGKGWSLDTGAVMLNKIQLSSGNTVNYYALSFGGRSYTLMRAESLPGVSNPDPNNLTHWAWRPTDESYIRVRVVQSGVSNPGSTSAPGRGASDYGAALPRYTWQVWTKDGTRYDFAEDGWWMWAKCSGLGDFAYAESNRWLLSSVTDTSGNTISYEYGRSNGYFDTCLEQSATVDYDIWPKEITWAGGRYRVEFVSFPRTMDTQADFPEYTIGGPARETQRLAAVKVWSYPTGSPYPNGTPQLMRQYNFVYAPAATSVLSDGRVCIDQPTCTTWAPNSTARLTLSSFQRIANDGALALPPTTFSYERNGGAGKYPSGGWNRLTGVNNGQGGTLTLTYENIAQVLKNAGVLNADLFKNFHRVTTRTETDGRGNSYTWSYSYGTPKVNSLGTTLDPSMESGLGTGSTPTSAVLYYNVFLDGSLDRDDEYHLPQRSWKEFRGHSTVTETDPSGAKTRRTFIQGDANCVPLANARGSREAIVADDCFKQMLRQEFLKGRETRTEQLTSGNTLLAETARGFVVGPVDYGWSDLSGLWRAFSYEHVVDEKVSEGGGVVSTKRTEYIYSGSFGPDLANMCNPAAGLSEYGTLSCVREYDRGTLVRQTGYTYSSPITITQYLVGFPAGILVMDGSQRILAQTLRFYDDNNTSVGAVGTRGRLTREIALQLPQPPLVYSGILNQWFLGRDTTYGYDGWGNRSRVTTYTDWGRALTTGSAWQLSAPGNGSSARSTITEYETIFNTLPTTVTNTLGHVELAGYDYRMGTLTSVTDANNQTTSATYDLFGRFSSLRRPGDSVSLPTVFATYHDAELPVRYALNRREVQGQTSLRSFNRYYDGLGRLIQEKAESQDGAQNIVTDYRYDGLGRLTQQSAPRYQAETGTAFWAYTTTPGSGVAWTTTAYDALGRALSVTEPDGAVTRHFYSVASGTAYRVRNSVDANRHRTEYVTDAFGRLAAVNEANGDCGAYAGYSCGGTTITPWTFVGTTSYLYSPVDLLSQVTDAKGNLTTLSYDSLGRKRAMSDPDMGNWSYTYDPNGNLQTQTDAKAQVLWFGYDALDRPTERRVGSSGGALRAQYGYDAGANGKGRRTSMSAGSASTSWQYDARGRRTQATHVVNGTTRSFGWQYDSGDRVTQTTYPSGDVLTHGYDVAWRPTSLSGTLSSSLASSGAYSARGQLESLTFGDNSRQQWQYDPATGRLTDLLVGPASGGTSFLSLEYSYDLVGNIKTLFDLGRNEVQNFAYDERDRLTRAWTTPGGSGLQQSLSASAAQPDVGLTASLPSLEEALVADLAAPDQAPPLSEAALAAAAPPTGPPAAPPATGPARDTLARLPLQFVENQGQTDPSVRFLARSGAGTLFVTPDEAVLSTPDTDPTIGAAVVRLQFLGARRQPAIRPRALLPGVAHYFVGDDPAAWRANLPTYDGVVYEQLYPGVDVHYEGNDGQLKRTYHVAAGANPAPISWRYQGATDVALDGQGNLLVTVPAPTVGVTGTQALTPTIQVFRTLVEQAPVAWQDVDGQRVAVEARYVVAQNKSVSLALGSYDPALPLVIDPVLRYSRALAGGTTDEALAITVNAAGEAYVVGATGSVNFPTQNPQQPNKAGGADAFVTRLSADGTSYVWSTYLGGSADDKAAGVALDSSGRVAVVGETESNNFPRVGAYDTSYGGGGVDDVFVTQLAADGSSLRYSTYLGGGGDDEGTAIAVDSAGNLLLTGRASSGYPTLNAYDSSHNGSGTYDMLLTRINPGATGGASLLYSTFVGASSNERGYAIAVDANNHAYIAGSSYNSGFPMLNAYDSSHNGGADALLVKLNPAISGTAGLLYSSYYGGSGNEEGLGVAVDASGNAYLTGYTSGSIPTVTPYQAARAGGADAFIAKLSTPSSGSGALLYGTYLGGTADDWGTAIVQNGAGSVSLTGWTRSDNYPTVQPTQAARGGDSCSSPPCRDAIVSQLNLSAAPASQLSFSSYLGGSYEEEGRGMARGSDGTLYVTGVTYSTAPSGSQSDAFVSAVNLSSLTTPAPYDESYVYDQIGNLLNKAGIAYKYGANGEGMGVGPHQARVVGLQNYSYDLNGNLTSGGGRTLVWDVENRPSSVTSGGVTESYAYDADGQRVSVTRLGVTTLYLEGVWEEVVGGASKAHYLLGGQLVAVRNNSTGATSYLHGDHLGSVGLVTGVSGGAPVVQSQQYFTPWGGLRAGSVTQTSLNYTGQRLDGTGLLYYTARYYDSAIGRFISADTIVPGSIPLTVWPSDSVASGAWGTSGSGPANPQELNRYSYALNNPIQYADPTGHWAFMIGIQVGGALFYGRSIEVGYASSTGGSGFYATEGAGQHVLGPALGISINLSVSAAPGVNDLSGPGVAVGGGVGLLSAEVSAAHNTLTGELTNPAFSVGAGFGIPWPDLHVHGTDTTVDSIIAPPQGQPVVPGPAPVPPTQQPLKPSNTTTPTRPQPMPTIQSSSGRSTSVLPHQRQNKQPI